MFCAESPNINPMAVMAVIVVRSTIGFRLSRMCPLDEQHVRSDRDIVTALEVERRRLQDDAKRPDLAKKVAGGATPSTSLDLVLHCVSR